MSRVANNIIIIFWIGIIVSALLSCKGKNNNVDSSYNNTPISVTQIKYAKGFKIEHFESYTRLTINNPWSEGNSYAVYNLYKRDEANLPYDGTNIKVPLQSIVVNTFSYFEFLELLDELDKITGTSDGFRIYNQEILSGIANGSIADLGDPFKLNIEKTLGLKPDAILSSAYAQSDNFSERIIKAGLPVIYNIEWMENSPLARAEWIKMIAVFFDKETAADSIFNKIETQYIAAKELAQNIPVKQSVMAGDNFQGTWYVPGGKSYNALLFNDAKLEYYFKDNESTGSIGLNIESILTNFSKANLWVGCEADTYKELLSKDSKYFLLSSVKNKRVFNNHKRITKSGGNDYFESVIANPDLILKDLIKAAYPELLPDYSFTYIKELE